MRFPGRRKHKHYFPVNAVDPLVQRATPEEARAKTHAVGVDQTLVDIDAKVPEELLTRYELPKASSTVIPDEKAARLYAELLADKRISYEFAGGTIGNTLHNYSLLADDASILLGVMSEEIRLGTSGYRYLSNTSSRVNLDHLQPVAGPIGRCFALVTPDGERTFAISAGEMNGLKPESIPPAVFDDASCLVISAYLLRCKPADPMPQATARAIELAKARGVPVVLTLGTKFVIAERPEFWREFIKANVDIVAMNEEEGEALTGASDPLLACDRALELADLVLCTAGATGLYLAGVTDDAVKRETRYPLLPGAIPEFNRYEFSRPMRRAACATPVKVFAHIAPYHGGPSRITSTNGAGDGALSALLHDMSANRYHRARVPNSAKHVREFLTYSSLSQICRYANRVSFEVLMQSSPRLTKGLPQREEGLDDEKYWAE
ncbi:MAG: inosine/guanosine kinase [Myxococcales bacterium]|nr:inosine/guanosine kinase [Myxococcales bacterium]MDP3503831.1 inosine/guanosine kinase [Myxococcales bacterium]